MEKEKLKPPSSQLGAFEETPSGIVQHSPLTLLHNDISPQYFAESHNPEDSMWDEWGRIYRNSSLRAEVNKEIRAKQQNISNILTDEVMIRAQMRLLHVPRFVSQQELRSLIDRMCGRQAAILNIFSRRNVWFVCFHNFDDARVTEKSLNGLRLYNHTLRVIDYIEFPEMDTSKHRIQPSVESFVSKHVLLEKHAENICLKFRWTDREYEELMAFKRMVLDFLNNNCKSSQAVSINQLKSSLWNLIDSDFIKKALSEWSIGLMRFLVPQVFGGEKEAWEPVLPSLISEIKEIVGYTLALLKHFGAQHVFKSIPWRVFMASLPLSETWPVDAEQFVDSVCSGSPQFIYFKHQIFLSQNFFRCTKLEEKSSTNKKVLEDEDVKH